MYNYSSNSNTDYARMNFATGDYSKSSDSYEKSFPKTKPSDYSSFL